MLEYYKNIIGNNISPLPNQQYRNDTQAFIDEEWDNTSTRYTVREQFIIGENIYNDIEVWIDYIVNQGSTSVKNGDDYRQFTFQDINHDVLRGRYYYFDDNFWLTYFTDEYGSLAKSLSVRRCNNALRWVNPDNGNIEEVPCVIDYEIGSARPKQDKDIIVADNSMVLWVQGNDLTRKLKQNQRFIFRGRPFKLAGFNNALMNGIINDSVTLYYYDLYLDTVQPTDDIENNIANRFEYDYSIQIIPDVTEQVNGFVGKLNANVAFNGEVVDRPITWAGNEYVTITGDTYTLNGIVGDVATLRANITGNDKAFDEISIKIVDTVTDIYEIITDPLNTEIRQNQTLVFDADLYKNRVKQADVVTAIATGAEIGSYVLTNIGNTYTLACKSLSSTPLNITFTSGIYTKTISIKLKSAF